ncbi:phosphoribosylformylglycinamidine synthase subunit PurS [Halovenus rubra]|uniref:Phosphoribosylformylglycinamidine synthase subunit PurS n=2 Tax=Halovenus rubra TaxID=869890 RepID=A0ABD5XAR6_9EURY|nr:phosphoribosylformylglycinamidine synthase subunit PurS [Halovenus rubra]
MTTYSATVTVRLKQGVLDPEAQTTKQALERLGFELDSLSSVDQFEIELDAESENSARERVTEMTERLLANPTMHDYEVTLDQR